MKKLGLILMLAISSTSFAAGLVLAERGKTADRVIVHEANAPESVKLACRELQKYLLRQTDVRLEIQDDSGAMPEAAIFVGASRHLAALGDCGVRQNDKPDDSFRLKASGRHLVINGGKRGALYGVFEVLERFGGCRWYSSWCGKVLKLDVFQVPENLDETQVPAFLMREPFWYDMFNTEHAYKNKCNGNQMHLEEKHGGKVRFGGGLFVHTMNQFIPEGEFFDSHPEYFSEIHGKRTRGYVQRCLTNPDVLRITTERLLERIRKDPAATMYSVSQNDVYNFCTCANCNAMAEKYGGQSGLLIWFVNQVAEAVEKEFPHALVETLAYQYTRTPPVGIKPRHNVVPRLCTIECDFSKPLDVSKHAQNVKFVKDIQGWSSMTDKLFIWDYTTDFHNYIGPFPNFGCLQGNVKIFRDNHVIGLMEQGAYQGYHAEFAELRGWILARLLWNPDQDIEPLYQDFFNGYYGKAAPLVRKYFDELQATVAAPENSLSIWASMSSPWLTDDFLKRSTTLWLEAEALVQNDPIIRYNVRKGSIPVFYARYMRHIHGDPAYRWTDEIVEPVFDDPEFSMVVKELLTRFDEVGPAPIGKRPIRIREGNSTLHDDWVRYARTSPVQSLKSDGWTLNLASDLGARGGRLIGSDGFNWLDADEGGINLNENPGDAFTDSDVEAYIEAKSPAVNTFEATCEKKELLVGKRYGVTMNGRNFAVDFELSVTNKGKQPGILRPVLNFALNLGTATGYHWKLDNGDWQSYVPVPCTLLDYAAISGAELAGKKTLTVAASGSRRAVRLDLPEAPCERLVFQFKGETVKLIIVNSASKVAAGQKMTRQGRLSLAVDCDCPEIPAAAQAVNAERLVYEDCAIPCNKRPRWGSTVTDEEALDKSALKLTNTHFEWCVQLRPNLALLKPDKTYCVRARVKVVPQSESGEAFWGGIYNTKTAEYYGNIAPKIQPGMTGYQWYVFSEKWHPHATDYIWMGPPRFNADGKSPVEGVYLDRIEFIEAQ